jgi:hypothetical protein
VRYLANLGIEAHEEEKVYLGANHHFLFSSFRFVRGASVKLSFSDKLDMPQVSDVSCWHFASLYGPWKPGN